MNISIVIPNYNGEKLLGKNFPKIFEAAEYYAQKSHDEVEIIVVDDASIDESIAFVKSQITNHKSQNINLKLIQNEKNLGFSSTVNRGVKEASGEIVILLNTDVAPQKDFLEPLIEHFRDQKIFAVGCMDKSMEGAKTVLRGRGIGKWERGFLIHARGEVDKTNTLWVSGGSGAFRKSIWEKLGGFNELYNPFYWEDIDLSYRALKSGYKVIFEPKSVVVHEHEKGAIKSQYSSFTVKTIAYRNQFIFVWKNITDMSLWFSHIVWLPYHLLKALLRGDLAFFMGFPHAFFMVKNILQCRAIDKKLFKKTDLEVLESF